MGLWLHLSHLPPLTEGRTKIAPLPQGERQQLVRLSSAQQWAQLLDLAETLCLQHRLCLDVQRYAAEALGGLGGAHLACAKAIGDAVGALVARLPGLVDLLAQDGSPLCDSATKAWVATLGALVPTSVVQPLGPLPQAAAPSAGAGENEAGDDAADDDPQDTRAQKPAALPQRAAYLARLGQAEAALAAGNAIFAAATFAHLYAEARRRHLFSWERDVSVRVLRGHLRCLGGEGANARRYAAAYARLTELDAKAANEVVAVPQRALL